MEGPFPEKDVEDVKSFGRVVVIFIALGGIFIPYSDLVYQASIYGGQFKGLYDYGIYLIWQPLVIIGILVVPILDLLIIPIFPKFEYFISNPLRGFTGYTFASNCSSYNFSNSSLSCLFSLW